MPKKLDIKAGDRFGRLTVICEAEKRRNKRHFLCRCDCGRESIVTVDNLNSGHSKSCGCYCNDINAKRLLKHGGCGTRLYEIWQGMKKRCFNKKCRAYKYYGGRGILVCQEWLIFKSFREWALSNGYNETPTLDRKDDNGNYEPSNCRWIPLSEQNNNKRNNRMIEYANEIKSIRDWSIKLNINYQTLYNRLKKGWPIEKAFNIVPRSSRCCHGD